MPYRALKVHWIQYENGVKVADLNSYHSNYETFDFFRMKFLRTEKKNQPQFEYEIGCKGWVILSDAQGEEIRKSLFGIWYEDNIIVKQFV